MDIYKYLLVYINIYTWPVSWLLVQAQLQWAPPLFINSAATLAASVAAILNLMASRWESFNGETGRLGVGVTNMHQYIPIRIHHAADATEPSLACGCHQAVPLCLSQAAQLVAGVTRRRGPGPPGPGPGLARNVCNRREFENIATLGSLQHVEKVAFCPHPFFQVVAYYQRMIIRMIALT